MKKEKVNEIIDGRIEIKMIVDLVEYLYVKKYVKKRIRE